MNTQDKIDAIGSLLKALSEFPEDTIDNFDRKNEVTGLLGPDFLKPKMLVQTVVVALSELRAQLKNKLADEMRESDEQADEVIKAIAARHHPKKGPVYDSFIKLVEGAEKRALAKGNANNASKKQVKP